MGHVTRRHNTPIKVGQPAETARQGKLCYLFYYEYINSRDLQFFRFGVCCLFILSTSAATISENCTYLQNPSFPSVYSSATGLTYTISKCATGNYSPYQSTIFPNFLIVLHWTIRCLYSVP